MIEQFWLNNGVSVFVYLNNRPFRFHCSGWFEGFCFPYAYFNNITFAEQNIMVVHFGKKISVKHIR